MKERGTLTTKIVAGFLLLYVLLIAATTGITFISSREDIYEEITVQYQEYFRILEAEMEVFFGEIAADLLTLSENPLVNTKNDEAFTTFLNADEKSFQYHYSPEETAIIGLFAEYRKNHPYVNSIYMGRVNGSFVRSHPRTSPTKYDPRERPWYKLAMANPDEVQLTEAYSSVTNKDVNIGSVLALKDEMGNLLGVIGMDVTLEDLTRKMEMMTLKYDGHVELWDERGVALVSSSKERLNTKVEDVAGQAILTEKGTSLKRIKDGYMVSKKTDALGETIVAFIPSVEVEKAIYRAVQSRVLLVTTVMILAFLLTFTLVEILVLRPLRNMQEQLILSHSEDLLFPRLMTIRGSGELKSFAEDYNELIKAIEKDQDELEKIKLLTISSLASLAEIRDFETGMHIVRTQKYVELLATAYNTIDPERRIPEKKLSIMVQCAPLHDIGKVAIPDDILLKPGKLEHHEFEIMKKHTVYGKDSFSKTNTDIGDSEFINTAINIAYYHHERWDGNGYPEGLAEDEIPIEARIMALADVYDALTTKRVYKDAINHVTAVGIIREGNGTQFDPAVVTAFLKIEGCLERISKLYSD